jgi:hypothetical protein
MMLKDFLNLKINLGEQNTVKKLIRAWSRSGTIGPMGQWLCNVDWAMSEPHLKPDGPTWYDPFYYRTLPGSRVERYIGLGLDHRWPGITRARAGPPLARYNLERYAVGQV